MRKIHPYNYNKEILYIIRITINVHKIETTMQIKIFLKDTQNQMKN